SGKDSLYRILSERLPLQPVVLYTTRPQRAHEQDGRDYHFIGHAELCAMRESGELIEERTYHTVMGDWTYCTAKGSVPLDTGDCLGIGTLESFEQLRDYFGAETVIPLYVEVEDGLRLQRALDRERAQEKPNYAELCRRFLTDTEDFSEEKLAHAGIVRRFQNLDLDACAAELTACITAKEVIKAFQICKLDESEKREYTLTMFPHFGEKLRPDGGIIDFENDIRLFYCGNGPYRESSNAYQFVFDYKGIAMNISISEKIVENDIYYSLLEVQGNGQLCIDEMKPFLREAIRIYGNQKYASHDSENSDRIHISFS
ncbi:MAG: hypothetical protein J5722_08195, partial [Oscillospiraceae bacterium]|nr:hypothetical protein [Oscillospiraceae bacterium]